MEISSWAAPVAVAVIGAVSAVAQNRRRLSVRDRIKSQLEIYDALPEESSSRKALLDDVDRQVSSLIESETLLTRDSSGIWVALLLIGGGVYTTVVVVAAGGAWLWFLIATIFLLLLGIVGLSESASKARRDSRGNKVKSSE